MTQTVRPFGPATWCLEWAEDVAHAIACLCLILLAAVVTWDVVSRLLLSVPLQMQFELTEFYLMPATALLSLAWVYRHNSHLALTLLEPESFGKLWPVLHLTVLVLSAAFFAAAAWRSGIYAYDAWHRSLVYFGVYDWWLWLAYAIVPVGTGLLTARLVHDIIGKILGKIGLEEGQMGGSH